MARALLGSRVWRAVGFLAAAACAAAAQDATVTDQAVSLVYSSQHWSAAPVADLLGVDAAGDPLRETGWWYRAQGDTHEYPFPVPDEVTVDDDDGSVFLARWFNLDGKGFHAQERVRVFDQEGPSGGFVSDMSVVNDIQGTSRTFTLFHYADVEVGTQGPNDTGTRVHPHLLKFTDGNGPSRAVYKAYKPTHHRVAPYPVLRDLLNNTLPTTLNDSGLPFGPGDATAAYQFGPLAIGDPVSLRARVALYVNPASDHVKGDYLGLMNAAPLVLEETPASSAITCWMHRTTCIDNGNYDHFFPSSPDPIVGIDDFDGDGVDEPVFRDVATGAVKIRYDDVVAPLYPPHWKLGATGDFTGDGKADILWRNTVTQRLVIWIMNGPVRTDILSPVPNQAVGSNWEVAGAGDFNGDGHRDILWYNQTSGNLVIWYMDQNVERITGGFTTPTGVGNNNWRVAAVGDYGKGPGGVYDTLDIVWQNDTSSKTVVWHMDKNGVRTGGVYTTPDLIYGGAKVVGPR